jgi:hypothetical protein
VFEAAESVAVPGPYGQLCRQVTCGDFTSRSESNFARTTSMNSFLRLLILPLLGALTPATLPPLPQRIGAFRYVLQREHFRR